MKKNLLYLLLIILLLTSNNGIAQVKNITYDFNARKYTKPIGPNNIFPENLKPGDVYTVTVENINSYCYNVKIESESHLDTTTYIVPGISSLPITAITGLFSSLAPPSLDVGLQYTSPNWVSLAPFASDLGGNFGTLNMNHGVIATNERKTTWSNFFSCNWFNKKSKSKKLEALLDAQIRALDNFKTSRDQIDRTVNNWLNIAKSHSYTTTPTFNITSFLNPATKPKESDIVAIQNIISSEKSNYTKEIMSYKEELKEDKYNARHKEIINSYDNLLLAPLSKLKSMIASENVNIILGNIVKKRIIHESQNITGFKPQITALLDQVEMEQAKIEGYENKIRNPNIALSAPPYSHTNLSKSLLGAFTSGRTSAQTLAVQIANALQDFQKEVNKIMQRMNPDKDLIAANKEVATTYDQLLKATSTQEENMSTENWKILLDRLLAISINQTQKIQSQPFQFNGDRGWIEITATPSRCPERPVLNSYKHHFPKKGKSKFATTSAFYISSLHDEVYSFKTEIEEDTVNNTIDTVYNAVNEESKMLEFGTSVMMNYVITNANDVQFSVAIGPGVSFTKSVRLRLLTGVNLSFGKRHRFAIGVGGISGYVDKKSSAVDINVPFTIKPETITVSKLDFGLYFNAGYQYRFNW